MFLLLLGVVFAEKFWVLTDSHFDDKYVANSPSLCTAIDCCHADSRARSGAEDQLSGVCGDYNCYAPISLWESALEYIKDHKNESNTIYWMMDVVPADYVHMSKKVNKQRVQQEVDLLKKYLPDFQVYPVPGNHDYYWSSWWQYPPESQWMLEFMGDLFAPWLSDDALETFKKGGYYSMKLNDKVRAVALHLAYVDVFNIHFEKYNKEDPAGMVQWFNDTLRAAKENSEKIFLFSHECVGLKQSGLTDLAPKFNQDFNNLMLEYHDIMLTHICGHSHYDSFRILPSLENSLYSCIVNPDMTFHGNTDARFRLMERDDDKVLGWTQYVLDLEKCNQNGKHEWEVQYNTKELYGMTEYSTKGIKEFVERLHNDEETWNTFIKLYSTHGGHNCDADCKKTMLCALQSVTEADFKKCKESN